MAKKTDSKDSSDKRRQRIALTLRWSTRMLFALFFMEVGFVFGLMPDWDQFTHGPIQKSRFIQDYEYEQLQHPQWPRLSWHPVPLSAIPDSLIRAVIVAEDARFYQHKGFDQEAISNAIEVNLARGRMVYGASTISQQTIKNFLLTHSRNPLRKLHETILTYAMEQNVGKQRILEIYLNIVEFDRGVYGVDAAARHYFGRHVEDINAAQAIDLAATLPAPTNHNPHTQTEFFQHHRARIARHLGHH